MAVYLVSNVKAKSQDWIPEYAQKVHPIAARHGGKYLSRSGNITAIEGERPNATIVALMQFPSMDDLMGFINDPEYAPYAKARQDGTDSILYAIDDTDLAGTIPELGKGGGQ